MGCCCGKDEVEEDPLSQATLQYIRDNLEANLVKQSTLNAELNNCYKKFEGKDNTNPDEVVKAYSDLLIKLTNTTTEKESNDIKELLSSAMKLVKYKITKPRITITIILLFIQLYLKSSKALKIILI